MSNEAIAYSLLRLTIGVDMFMHGVVRIPNYSGFANHLVEQFQGTLLPSALTLAFGYTLPFLEGAVGLFLILGLFTRYALVMGSVLMIVLIFGTALRQEWNTIGVQLVYSIIYFILLLLIHYNNFSVDRLMTKKL